MTEPVASARDIADTVTRLLAEQEPASGARVRNRRPPEERALQALAYVRDQYSLAAATDLPVPGDASGDAPSLLVGPAVAVLVDYVCQQQRHMGRPTLDAIYRFLTLTGDVPEAFATVARHVRLMRPIGPADRCSDPQMTLSDITAALRNSARTGFETERLYAQLAALVVGGAQRGDASYLQALGSAMERRLATHRGPRGNPDEIGILEAGRADAALAAHLVAQERGGIRMTIQPLGRVVGDPAVDPSNAALFAARSSGREAIGRGNVLERATFDLTGRAAQAPPRGAFVRHVSAVGQDGSQSFLLVGGQQVQGPAITHVTGHDRARMESIRNAASAVAEPVAISL